MSDVVSDVVRDVVRIEVCIDTVDPAGLLPFWRAALGYVPDPQHPDQQLLDPDGRGPTLWFQRVPEAKAVKNRVHLDVFLADRAAARRRRDALVALGGRETAAHDTFLVLADPEGNEFCLCWEDGGAEPTP